MVSLAHPDNREHAERTGQNFKPACDVRGERRVLGLSGAKMQAPDAIGVAAETMGIMGKRK